MIISKKKKKKENGSISWKIEFFYFTYKMKYWPNRQTFKIHRQGIGKI